MNQYYYYDGTNPVGPHSAAEIAQLLKEDFLSGETQLFLEGGKDWQKASAYPELSQTQLQEPAQRLVVAENQGETGETAQTMTPGKSPGALVQQDEVEDEEAEQAGLSKFQILREIRSELNRLWTCQRESIIATIRCQELESEHVQTRRQAREIKNRIEALAVDYFRKSNVLRDWIHDLTWESEAFRNGRADVRRRITGDDCQERYENSISWLDKIGLAELEGCYCFQNSDKSYRYIGRAQSQSLGQRLKNWERASFWLESSHLRIIIPKFKSQTTKLERLLIMQHQPAQNEKPGDRGGNNPADKVLEMIHSEIQDLLTDG